MSGSKSHHVRMFAGVVTAALRLAFVCLPFIRCVFAETPVCADLLQTTPKQKLNYLRRDRAKLNPDCVVYAIQELGAQRYNAGAYVLATYLDFRAPGTEQRGQVIMVQRIPWIGDLYPAANALSEIGKGAYPALIRVLASADSSDLVRTNALEVVFVIYREDIVQAARALGKAGASEPDTSASARLLDAARKFAAKCPIRMRNSCEAAIVGP